ncbi:MAG: FAD/NAD(P)-binding protein [Pseudomonadota bacterium]
MLKDITRRDLLQGLTISAGGMLLQASGVSADFDAKPPSGEAAALRPNYYPPTLTGMRGSHEGSFEVAHALAWRGEKPGEYQALNEHYDLVVVGAGMSGLAAAHYFRKKRGVDARILLLDNHDDFGGHAKRNEFHHNGRMLLSIGGAQNLEDPAGYSEVAASLLADIGIDEDFIEAMDGMTPDDYTLGGKLTSDMGMAVPGDNGHVAVNGNWTMMMQGADGYEQAVRELPIQNVEQDKLIDLFGGHRDFLDGLSLHEKWAYINSVSYNQYLVDKVGLSEETLPILNAGPLIYAGIGGWNLSVLEAFASVAGGIRSMGWVGKLIGSIGLSLVDSIMQVRMFPDGNASVARLIVQQLIPDVAPGMKGTEDVAIARFDYDALDQEDKCTRLRLNSTVVGVREIDGKRVEVDYVRHGKPLRVTADHCVLACYNGFIPHLCPELPETQKEGLKYGVKAPFVYANVLLDNGRAFSKMGASMYQSPYDSFQWVSAAPTMSVGGYQPPRNADDPMALFMMSSPIPQHNTKATARDVLRTGRHKVYATPFASYEKDIRDQLQALLGKHGFNHESDIKAITVNRIPHGYAYTYLSLDDPEWEKGQAPHEIGRQQFGRISIANSDSEAMALMNAAFDAGWRAVEEQTA